MPVSAMQHRQCSQGTNQLISTPKHKVIVKPVSQHVKISTTILKICIVSTLTMGIYLASSTISQKAEAKSPSIYGGGVMHKSPSTIRGGAMHQSVCQSRLPLKGPALLDRQSYDNTLWLETIDINKSAHIKNGNVHQGNDIKFTLWNKGNSYLENAMTHISQVIQDMSPDILTITEAELRQNTPLQLVQIPGYRLHTDSLYHYGGTARTVVYSSNKINVSVQNQYFKPEISIVPLLISRGPKKINLLAFYRQWALAKPTREERLATRPVACQADRFDQICQVWQTMIDTQNETISMSDSNLSLKLLSDDDNLTQYDLNLKPVAQAFHNEILTRGVTILNRESTHWSSSRRAASCLDHITTTHPAKARVVKTINSIHSDHKIVQMTRNNLDRVSQPRYIATRDYKSIDKQEMAWDLMADPSINRAKHEVDPDQVVLLLQQGMIDILDRHARKRIIQLKTRPEFELSVETRNLQQQATDLKTLATATNDPATWQLFRSIRNLSTAQAKLDVKTSLNKKIESKGCWKTAKMLQGDKMSGPPSYTPILKVVL